MPAEQGSSTLTNELSLLILSRYLYTHLNALYYPALIIINLDLGVGPPEALLRWQRYVEEELPRKPVLSIQGERNTTTFIHKTFTTLTGLMTLAVDVPGNLSVYNQ